jgi:translation initiation factor IF-1
MKESTIIVEGNIGEVLRGPKFRVKLDNGHCVLATLCGRLIQRWIKLSIGDRVRMEMTHYDLSKGRIVWRL